MIRWTIGELGAGHDRGLLRAAVEPACDLGEALGQMHAATGVLRRPVVALELGDLGELAPREVIEGLEEEQRLEDRHAETPRRILADEVRELVREHALLLLGGERIDRTLGQADLVAHQRQGRAHLG